MLNTNRKRIWDNWIVNSRKYTYDLPQSKFSKNIFSLKRAKKSGKIQLYLITDSFPKNSQSPVPYRRPLAVPYRNPLAVPYNAPCNTHLFHS